MFIIVKWYPIIYDNIVCKSFKFTDVCAADYSFQDYVHWYKNFPINKRWRKCEQFRANVKYWHLVILILVC